MIKVKEFAARSLMMIFLQMEMETAVFCTGLGRAGICV
jgi:hypothetical protein